MHSRSFFRNPSPILVGPCGLFNPPQPAPTRTNPHQPAPFPLFQRAQALQLLVFRPEGNMLSAAAGALLIVAAGGAHLWLAGVLAGHQGAGVHRVNGLPIDVLFISVQIMLLGCTSSIEAAVGLY